MRSTCFLDTNVLIYAATGRHDYPRHWEIAHDILAAGGNGLSGQVLAEFYVVTTKKYGLPVGEAFEWIRRLSLMPVAEVGSDIVVEGIALSQRYQIHYWDAALIAAAGRLGAGTLYTEDLNHGQLYGTVRAVNPFPER
ncbi:twitching motility protein PilT [Aureimonas sp. SA4125]|uniref:PIN domain-containing protein n=1 Tax=Aureimonas sp. SA4125 TaxID=2826993 RepID=UPI001CC62C57|nr:PIN domain-containing protein [Aureimonas sp. SA4125]BDA86807.1 twitching motility protein PilT [Aureimonas sp. SA4125]